MGYSVFFHIVIQMSAQRASGDTFFLLHSSYGFVLTRRVTLMHVSNLLAANATSLGNNGRAWQGQCRRALRFAAASISTILSLFLEIVFAAHVHCVFGAVPPSPVAARADPGVSGAFIDPTAAATRLHF